MKDIPPEIESLANMPLKTCLLLRQKDFIDAITTILELAYKLGEPSPSSDQDAQSASALSRDSRRDSARSIIITIRDAAQARFKEFDRATSWLNKIIQDCHAFWRIDQLWHAKDPRLSLLLFSNTLQRQRVSSSFRPFITQFDEKAPPFTCVFVEGVGMVIALPGNALADEDDTVMGLWIDFGQEESDKYNLASMLRRIFHLPDMLGTSEHDDGLRETPAHSDNDVLQPIMHVYDLLNSHESTEFWTIVIKALTTSGDPLWCMAMEMPIAAFDLVNDAEEIDRLTDALREANAIDPTLEAPTEIKFRDLDAIVRASIHTPQEIHEIINPEYIRKGMVAALTAGNMPYVAALGMALRAVLRRITNEADPVYQCRLSDDFDHSMLLIAPESNWHRLEYSLFIRKFSRHPERAGIAIPILVETEEIRQAFATHFLVAWDAIPPDKRSNTREGNRAIVEWLRETIDSIQASIEMTEIEADAAREELRAIAAKNIEFALDSEGILQGNSALTLTVQSNSPIRYAGSNPTDVLSEPALAMAYARPLLNALPPRNRAGTARDLRIEHERQRQALYAHRVAALPTCELWNRKAALQFFMGSPGLDRQLLPQAPLQHLALDILSRIESDPSYEVRLTNAPLEGALWLCKDPRVCAIYAPDRSTRTWGRITSDLTELEAKETTFERLWQEAAVKDQDKIARFIVEAASLAQPATFEHTASFLDRAVPIAGLPVDAFVQDIAEIEDRSTDLDRYDIFFNAVPQTWFPTKLLMHEDFTAREVFGRAKLKRAARFQEMLYKQRAPLRLLSQLVPFERWVREASEEYLHYFEYLLSLPFIKWRLTQARSPLLYEIISDNTLMIERFSDSPSNDASSIGVGWMTTQEYLIGTFAQHFNSTWQDAMDERKAREHFRSLIQRRRSSR